MAKAPNATESETAEAPVPRRGPGAIVWMLVLMVAAISGVAVPFLVPASEPRDSGKTGGPTSPVAVLTAENTVAIPFGEVTVNLDEGRMNRYLRLKISVLVAKDDQKSVTEEIAAKNAVLKNWLLSHLSDKALDEIRGKAGQNMLRREIRREFNETLFSDSRDRIYDVLFEEFNVQ